MWKELGKRRIFAIGNYIKQRLLHPVHSWAMKVLSLIPMDGTFDQQRPIKRLSDFVEIDSFDLKSATDRWPLSIIYTLKECLFGSTFASVVVNSSLGLNSGLETSCEAEDHCEFCGWSTFGLLRLLGTILYVTSLHSVVGSPLNGVLPIKPCWVMT